MALRQVFVWYLDNARSKDLKKIKTPLIFAHVLKWTSARTKNQHGTCTVPSQHSVLPKEDLIHMGISTGQFLIGSLMRHKLVVKTGRNQCIPGDLIDDAEYLCSSETTATMIDYTVAAKSRLF